MNAAACRIALRPRGPLESFDLTLLFARANARVLLPLLAVTVVPIWLPMVLGCWVFDGHPALLILPLPFLGVLQTPFTILGGRLLFDATVGWRGALRSAISKDVLLLVGLRMVFAWMCVFTLGLGLLALPGWHFLPETLLLEKMGGRRGLQRSNRLGTREPLGAIAGVLSRMFLTVWFAFTFELAGQAIVSTALQLGTPFGSIWSGQITPFLLLGVLVAQPVHALYRLLLYIDARTVAEGWDLQVGLWAVGREGNR